jgi:DNA repair protein RadC
LHRKQWAVLVYSYKNPIKPSSPPLQSTRLLDQVRERIRCLHYSLSTEKTLLYWVRFFVGWAGRGGNMRHPHDMGAQEVAQRALHHQAAAVVLAHNHPSGSVQPSNADIALTQTLKTTLALIDVRVLDHIMVPLRAA